MTRSLPRAPEAVAELRFVLPFPPSVNRYYRNVGYRTLLSREGRAYRQLVGARLAGRVGQPLSGALEVQLDLVPPDRRRRDWDNFQKGIWDALQHAGVYRDDSQIRKATVLMCDPDADPRAEVVILPFSRNEGPVCRCPSATTAVPATASATSKSATVPVAKRN